MQVNYRNIDGYQESKPKTVDLTSAPGKVYLRRNIISVPNVNEEGEIAEGTHWNYDEALLTADQYEEYLGDVQSPSIELIMQTLSDLQLQIDEL